MPPDNDQNQSNPILSAALNLLNQIAPCSLVNPEKALRELVPTLRFLVVAKIEKPAHSQLEAIRALDNSRSLVQIRNAIQTNEIQFGPFPGDLAERALMPGLVRQGLFVSLRELTPEEKAEFLDNCDDPPG